jgi:hypothetical protein
VIRDRKCWIRFVKRLRNPDDWLYVTCPSSREIG